MKILESIYDDLLIVGLSSDQSIQKYPFNARNVTSLIIFALNILCDVGFLVSGTADLKEFSDSMFAIVTASLTTVIFIDLIWKMRKLFEFLRKLEETVNQSK